MNDDIGFAYPDEDYREVERMFHELAPNTLDEFGEASQYARLFQHLVPRIRESAERNQLSGIEFDERLQEVEKVIDDLAGALQAHREEREPGAIWIAPERDEPRFEEPECRARSWNQVSPVDKVLLEKATAAYLERPWMQLNYLDWCILNGYVFDDLVRLGEGARSPGPAGRLDWPYLFSGGDLAKQIFWRIAFEISKFLIRWLLVPLAIAAVYSWESQEIGIWIAAVYTVYLVVHIAISPKQGLSRGALLRFMDRRKRLDDLGKIYQDISAQVIHPTRLRDLISKAEAQGGVFKPAIYSILDRAIARDSTVLAIEDVG